jgi:hypothetical protein
MKRQKASSHDLPSQTRKGNMTTVIDALRNAHYNFKTLGKFGANNHPAFTIGMDQLNNAINALENGMKPDDIIQEHIFDEVVTQPKTP